MTIEQKMEKFSEKLAQEARELREEYGHDDIPTIEKERPDIEKKIKEAEEEASI